MLQQLTSKWDIVKVCWRLNGRDTSANVELLYSCTQIRHGWMSGAICTKDLDSLIHAIGLVYVIDYERVRLRTRVRPG
jgi:hypothetical protein